MESSNTGSASTSKSTDPFIRIDSISINLPSSKSVNKMASCEHFSMRKYVSEMRQKDQTACWPFEFGSSRNDTTEASIHKLPPLDVPKFRWWKCQNCLLEPVTEITGTAQKTTNCKCKSGSACTHDIADSETAELVTKFKHMVSLDMAEIRKHDDAAISAKANGNKLHALIPSQGEDRDHGIENLLKVPEKDAAHQDLPCPDGIPTQVDGFTGQEQGMDAKVGDPSNQNDYLGPNKLHIGNLEVGSIRDSIEDLKIQVNASRSDQQIKLVRSCQASETVNTVTIENEQKPCEEVDGHDPPSSDSAEICPSSRDKSGRLQHRKVRKVRLMTDLLGEKGNSNAEHSRTRDSPLQLAVLDRSEEVGTTENVKKGLHAQKRKRNLPSDEDFKMEETVIPNKEFQKVEIVRGNATNPEALVGSALDKDAFAKLSSDSATKSDWMKYRYAESNGSLKKKLKKKENKNQIVEQSFQIKESDLRCKNVPMAVVGSFVENDASRSIATTIVRIDKSKLGDDFAAAEKEKKKKKNDPFHNKVGEPRFKAVSNPNVLPPAEDDGLLSRETESLFNSELKMGSKSCVCKKKSKVPHVNDYDQFTFRSPLVTCKTQESGDTRKDSGTVQIGSAVTQLPKDARLRNAIEPPLVGTQFSTQVECGVSRQEDAPKEDQLLKKSIKFRYPEPNILSTSGSSDPLRKGRHADKESKRTTYGMPLMYQKQDYLSQSKDETQSVMLQKDVQGASTKGNIVSQDQEAVKSKPCSEVADSAAPAPITSDDIPMDIVELMAKIQHDNRLYDAAKSKKKLSSSLHNPSTAKEQHHPKSTKLGKQKMVSFSSQVTTNQMSTNPSSEKTHVSKSRGAFTLYQEVCDGVPVRHRSSGAIDNVREAVGPWSSTMFMNSPPQERVKFLDFKSHNPEKKNRKKDLHLEPPPYYPPRQNGSKLQNQFGPPADFYSNEKIPAMHLLSLMDAGRKSGQSSGSNGAPSRFEKQPQQSPLPHGYHSKELGAYPSAFAGMNFSVYDKAADRSNHTSMDYHSLSATHDGNSSSRLLQTDENFRRGSVVPPPQSLNQIKARDKGKRKLEGSSSAAQKSLPPPVQNSLRKSDTTLLNPMIFDTGGKKKLKSNNAVVDWSPRSSSETEICCTVNRNPADFSSPGPGNSYMIRGKEIKYFSRKTTLRHCTENSGRETKRQLTAAALLAELQIL